MNAVWLIAGREFRAYVTTASFWIALLIGPALAVGAVALAGGRDAAPPPATLSLVPAHGGGFEARFSPGFPASGRARSDILRRISADGRVKGGLRLAAPAPTPADPRALSRFVLTLALWITLTGSLGMLLQAVVRERANRALECLLAAARPAEIVAGKLAGVGCVSALVAGSWLAAGAAAGGGAGQEGARAALFGVFSDPATLVRAAGLYGLAFAFYGFLTIAVGARARDSADAQNLARPLFAVLLAVFFAALSAAGGASGLGWLSFLPPFTPFMLLMRPPPPPVEAAAVVTLAISVMAAAWLASACVGPGSGAPRPRFLWRRKHRE